jgi:hypothetical protein
MGLTTNCWVRVKCLNKKEGVKAIMGKVLQIC